MAGFAAWPVEKIRACKATPSTIPYVMRMEIPPRYWLYVLYQTTAYLYNTIGARVGGCLVFLLLRTALRKTLGLLNSLLLKNEDLWGIRSMEQNIEDMELAVKELGEGKTAVTPRARIYLPTGEEDLEYWFNNIGEAVFAPS